MGQPQVSVIIPSYNCEPYLAEAIDSVLAQTYQNFEIIVIDDGSTDCTAELLQTYGSQIRAIHQPNQGVALARNHGIQQAQGEWIAFLDADDVFLPDKLAAQMALASADSRLGIIHSGWHRVDAQGNRLLTVEPWRQVPELNLESWLRWKPVLPSAMLFRRQWLEQAGGFDPRFPPAEDTELVLRLALMGCSAKWLPQVTVNYRQHGSSAMHKGLPQARSLAAVIDHLFAQPHLPEQIRWLENQVRYSTLVWIAWYLYQTGHLTEMVEHLQRALPYSPYTPIETLVQWGDSFTSYAASWGEPFDAEMLGQSAQWQKLMQWVIQTHHLKSL
ncbi:MAG: glycosyltransferase [Cyanobacteria bacterium RM1_2_2]|nr:glycosyltransferase [Cyanobacteria bacterium RM1_2_2]